MEQKQQTTNTKEGPKLIIPKARPFDKEAFIKNAKKVRKIFEKEGRLPKEYV